MTQRINQSSVSRDDVAARLAQLDKQGEIPASIRESVMRQPGTIARVLRSNQTEGLMRMLALGASQARQTDKVASPALLKQARTLVEKIRISLGRTTTIRDDVSKALQAAGGADFLRGTKLDPTTVACHPAFEVKEATHIEGMKATFIEYEHKATGARHVHVDTQDDNNAFCIAFRTLPQDSTGVAHILEHTVLCGSEKYPVRDPFFSMSRRSLNTFLNAMTWPDRTAYPFSTQNAKDFDNIMRVYLDAVFFPRLHKLDFAQEGWRLEFEKHDDPTTPLVYRGVVFNEMKGALESPDRIIFKSVDQALYPDTTYAHESGGDPDPGFLSKGKIKGITDLTHEDLLAFHRKHYHPSNAVFFSYGSFPVLETQERVEEAVLSRFDERKPQFTIEPQPTFDKPRVHEMHFNPSAGASPTLRKVMMAWGLGLSSDTDAQLNAMLLEQALLGPGAPLVRALESSDLGAAPYASGLDASQQMTFFCGLDGVEPGDEEAVEKLIMNTLEKVAENGVPHHILEGVLKGLEYKLRSTGANQGVNLATSMASELLEGRSAAESVDVAKHLETLRENIKNPEFIKGLVRDLLDNQHRVRLVAIPDPTLNARKETMVEEHLQALHAQLTPEQKQELADNAIALRKRQATPDDPSVLPKLGLEDVPERTFGVDGNVTEIAGMKTHHYGVPSNGIASQGFVVDIPNMSQELAELLPMYAAVLGEVGVGKLSHQEFDQRFAAWNGSIGASLTFDNKLKDPNQVAVRLSVAGRGLTREAVEMNSLLRDMLIDSKFDDLDRLRELLRQMRVEMDGEVLGNPSGLAIRAAVAPLSKLAATQHAWAGLGSFDDRRKRLDEALSDPAKLKSLSEKLTSIHNMVTQAPRRALLISDPQHGEALQHVMETTWRGREQPSNPDFAPLQLAGTAEQLGSNNITKVSTDNTQSQRFADFLRRLNEGVPSSVEQGSAGNAVQTSKVGPEAGRAWATNSEVNYCVKAFPTVHEDHEDAPALAVLARFVSNGFLHTALREQGGAYGGSARYLGSYGATIMTSYRDPRIGGTFEDFDRVVEWLDTHKHSTESVEEAILGVISGLDAPTTPEGAAKASFVGEWSGRNGEFRKKFRDGVLKVTLDDLKRVGQKYLKSDQTSSAVVGNAEQLAEEGPALGLTVRKLGNPPA